MFVRFDTEAAVRIVDAVAIVSHSVEGLMEHQHRRYSSLDWPTRELVANAHRLRAKAMHDAFVALGRSLRSAVAALSKPDVHGQAVPIPLVEGAEASRLTGGDQRRRAANGDGVEDVVSRRA